MEASVSEPGHSRCPGSGKESCFDRHGRGVCPVCEARFDGCETRTEIVDVTACGGFGFPASLHRESVPGVTHAVIPNHEPGRWSPE